MKKIMMALAAALMMSSSVLAQDEKPEMKQQQKMPDRTEMVKRRTEETVKRYGLNDEQAALLLELNTKYADKMGAGRRGPRPEGRKGMGQQPMKQRQQTDAQPADSVAKKEGPQMMRGNREQMRKEMEEYDAEVKKIMTEEQYEKYKADREKRMRDRPQGGRRERNED